MLVKQNAIIKMYIELILIHNYLFIYTYILLYICITVRLVIEFRLHPAVLKVIYGKVGVHMEYQGLNPV